MLMEPYKVVVSEPWDYTNENGSNEIVGRIVKVLSVKSLIFEAESVFTVHNHKGKRLLLKGRYVDEFFLKDNFYEATVNGSIIPDSLFDSEDEKLLEAESKFILIGSLKRIGK